MESSGECFCCGRGGFGESDTKALIDVWMGALGLMRRDAVRVRDLKTLDPKTRYQSTIAIHDKKDTI